MFGSFDGLSLYYRVYGEGEDEKKPEEPEFERVNKGVQELFPRLFGGGHAYLELTGDDLLSAGVTVMARPPGKRNASIHLLSGGEKALTAVALVFAIFRLNPAPFCMLDEVDAPLDAALLVGAGEDGLVAVGLAVIDVDALVVTLQMG